jgi:hypothetical protein
LTADRTGPNYAGHKTPGGIPADLWIAAYEAAVFETDNALMPGRILEALAAIEQRLLSPIDIDGHECESITRPLGTPDPALNA